MPRTPGLVSVNKMSNPFVRPFFEILAGPNHTSFLVHASILEKSEKLRAIVKGEWKDSLERQIVLEDWDPETVGRLLEWLYTDDYKSPFPAEVPQSEAEVAEIRVKETSLRSSTDVKNPQSTAKNEGAKGSQRPLTPLEKLCFKKVDTEFVLSHAEALKQWTQDCLQSDCVFNFEASLLAHAKLYALADYVLLPNLQAQAFQHLKALLLFISSPKFAKRLITNTTVIVNLLRLVQYVYANTARLESEEEPLRELISTFIALHDDHFVDDGGEVSRLMEQGGDFQGDVHDKVRRNEVALKTELKAVYNKLREANNTIKELTKPKW